MDISDMNRLRLGAAVLEAEYGVWNRVAPAMVSAKTLMDESLLPGSAEKKPEFWLVQWKTCIDASADNLIYLMEKVKDTVSQIEHCQKRADGEYSQQDLKEISYRYTYISNTFHWEDHQKEKVFQEIKQLKNGIEKTVSDLKQDIKEFFLLQEDFPAASLGIQEIVQSVKKKFYETMDGIICEFTLDGQTASMRTMEALKSKVEVLEGLSRDLSSCFKKLTGKDIPVFYVKKELSEWQELIRTESLDVKKTPTVFLAAGRKVQGNYGLSFEDGAYLMDKKI